MNKEYQIQIEDCYSQYCGIIKPLIARIEALSEKIPLPIFNEIRAFNDHIARCYYNNPDEEYIKEQISKAQRHIVRITLDCFKCLNVILYSEIENFEKRTKNVDLTVINNGLFFPEYTRLKVEAAEIVREAKIKEGYEPDEALYLYQDANNVYTDIVNQLNSISENVKWARIKFPIKRILTILGWIISIVISALISAYFSCEILNRFID